MFDVLMDLLNSLERGHGKLNDREAILSTLKNSGLKPKEVDSVVEAIEKVIKLQDLVQHAMPRGGFPIRHYTPEEQKRLDTECRGFLLHLEQVGLLPPELRETVINQAMKLEEVDFDLARLRLLIILILFQHSSLESIITHYEHLVQEHPEIIN